jgi:small subunit ribosomal protein S20
MPLIKSAKKQNRQNAKHRVRNFRVRDVLKDSLKGVLEATKDGKKVEAEKALQTAYKAIDMADKKNIIHSNNAARKKSSMAKLVANMGKKKASTETAKKKAAPKAAAKKEEAKVEEVAEAPEATEEA